MADELVTRLLPVLSRSLDQGFNVFDVMHHGSHEKQISNVFRWLLERGGSHGLEDLFVRIFVDEVNRGLVDRGPFPIDAAYTVRQEVDTSIAGAGGDIADIVLENSTARLVIENYYTSDGHGHSYHGYLAYGQRDGRDAAVILLCHEEDRSLQTGGWENAAVLTYEALLARLRQAIDIDRRYKQTHPEPYSFIDQMHRRFGRGEGHMGDRDILDFVIAMCDAGEAGRYGEQKGDITAEKFASDLAQQARERFNEGRSLLQKTKDRLKSFTTQVLVPQLREAHGDGFVQEVKVHWRGIYQWSVILHVSAGGEAASQEYVALVFGPTAWHLWNESDRDASADFSRLSLWSEEDRQGEKVTQLRESAVTLHEVLDGLESDDVRLRDEIPAMLTGMTRSP